MDAECLLPVGAVTGAWVVSVLVLELGGSFIQCHDVARITAFRKTVSILLATATLFVRISRVSL